MGIHDNCRPFRQAGCCCSGTQWLWDCARLGFLANCRRNCVASRFPRPPTSDGKTQIAGTGLGIRNSGYAHSLALRALSRGAVLCCPARLRWHRLVQIWLHVVALFVVWGRRGRPLSVGGRIADELCPSARFHVWGDHPKPSVSAHFWRFILRNSRCSSHIVNGGMPKQCLCSRMTKIGNVEC